MNLSVSVRPSHARLPKAHGVPTTASCFTLACTDQPRPWQLCRKVFMKPCLLSGPVSSRYCKFRYENKSLRLDATVIDYSPLLIIGAKVRHAPKAASRRKPGCPFDHSPRLGQSTGKK